MLKIGDKIKMINTHNSISNFTKLSKSDIQQLKHYCITHNLKLFKEINILYKWLSKFNIDTTEVSLSSIIKYIEKRKNRQKQLSIAGKMYLL